MSNKNILKLLIFFSSALYSVTMCYGDTEVESTPVLLEVQPAVVISKQVSSVETGTINPATGESSGLVTLFDVQTNGTDENYDFIIKSSILTENGNISAYGSDGSLLFGHTLVVPTESAIKDAKLGGNNNINVIAYPVSAIATDPMTIDFRTDYGTYGDCYVLKVNNGTEGTVTHSVGQSPISGTYNIGQDQSGTYQSVVTFSAVSK